MVFLNLGFNKFQVIPDFSSFKYLRELRMNDNQIKEMVGLQKCTTLRLLDLSNNSIECIEGINDLGL